MDQTEPDSFSKRWKYLHLQDRLKQVTTSEKADILRNILSQVEIARANKTITHQAACTLFHREADRYSGLVDSPDETKGLNNYADAALSLLEGKPNDSQQWKTSFDHTETFKMSCVKRFMEASKAAAQVVIPPGKENESIILRIPASNSNLGQAANYSDLCESTKPDSHGLFKSRIIPSPPTNIIQPQRDPVNTVRTIQDRTQNTGGNIGHNPSLNGRPTAMMSSNASNNFWTMGSRGYTSVQSSHADGAASSRKRYGDEGVESQPYRRSEPLKRQRDNDDTSNPDTERTPACGPSFRTAREQLVIDSQKKYSRGKGGQVSPSAYGANKKSLGTRRGLNSKFVPPVLNREDQDDRGSLSRKCNRNMENDSSEEPVDERLKNIEPKMIELITNEIMDHGPAVSWDDIAGLEFAKKTIKEIVIWPMLRPDIFTGLRGPPKGLLLFGPPGTGKTLIGKCIASQSKSTFFSISASSLTSKWVGEGEKMVRALFAVARVHQPAVIFIDEIDSLLSQRSESEHESSRRIKTEFLVQLDGATTGEDERILVVGATNRPQELDEAARRRFVKRLYIPLPEEEARSQIVRNLLSRQKQQVTPEQLQDICKNSDGYSGADMANLCREAALGPIRNIAFNDIENITADQVRPILFEDFTMALKQVRASVSEKDLDAYIVWNKQYGSWSI